MARHLQWSHVSPLDGDAGVKYVLSLYTMQYLLLFRNAGDTCIAYITNRPLFVFTDGDESVKLRLVPVPGQRGAYKMAAKYSEQYMSRYLVWMHTAIAEAIGSN